MRVIYPLFMLIELMLYYTSMVIVSTKLFGAVCHKKRLLISYIVLFVPLLMIELAGDFSLANQVSILFFVPEILFLRLCLSRIRLRTLMAEYWRYAVSSAVPRGGLKLNRCLTGHHAVPSGCCSLN